MSEDDVRSKARAIAQKRFAAGEPLAWFEDLYAQAAGDAASIPWADLAPNPNLVSWLDRHEVRGQGKRALVVGCGLGDDAEALVQRGFAVTAFDIAPSAIAWCKQRFPSTAVEYRAGDLLNPPDAWLNAFDFVFEAYTLQSLPADLRAKAIAAVASFVRHEGRVLIVARGRDAHDPEGTIPWPLTREELGVCVHAGLEEESFEDYLEPGKPPVRRFRVVFKKHKAENGD